MNKGSYIMFHEAHFQEAYTCFSCHAFHGIADIIVSTNTDFAALADVCGLCMTLFSTKKGSKTESKPTPVDINLSLVGCQV